MGSSSSRKLGTRNLFSCLAPAFFAANDGNGHAILAHIDDTTDVSSLQASFDSQLDIREFKCRLVGARPGNPFVANPFAEQVAYDNVRKTLRYFIEHPTITFNIISADILKKQQRTGFVVNPETGELSDTVPPTDIDSQLMEAMREINILRPSGLGQPSEQVPLTLVYNDERGVLPLSLTAEAVDILAELHRTQYFDLYDRVITNYPGDAAKAIIVMNDVAGLYQAWNASVDQLVEYLDARINELQGEGYIVPASQRDAAINMLRTRPLFVGSQAAACNAGYEEAVTQQTLLPVETTEKKMAIAFTRGNWPTVSEVTARTVSNLAVPDAVSPPAPDAPTSPNSMTDLVARYMPHANPRLREVLGDTGNAINVTQPEDLYRTSVKSQKPPTRSGGQER